MKKSSTAVAQSKRNFHQKLTIGLDLGDRSSWYCVLDEAGEVIHEQKLSTTPKAMQEVFASKSYSSRDGHTFAMGKPTAGRARSRSDRGACPQRAVDRGEPTKG